MCGIAGICLNPSEACEVDVNRLVRELLLGIEERGRHATGVSFFDGSELMIDKAPVPASTYVRSLDLPGRTRNVLCHTRWATQGSPSDNENNHPIDARGVVGVHNGCVSNDAALYDQVIGRKHRFAEVDSMAIFAGLAHTGMEPRDFLPLVRGSAAVAWQVTDGNPGEMFLARVSSSPLIVAQTAGGSLLFASTARTIDRAARAADLTIEWTQDVPEGTLMRVRDGHIADVEHFTVAQRGALSVTERTALGVG